MSRLGINKTYKLYVGGKFPRTESGRYYDLTNSKGEFLANLCLSSRKDFRNAVVVARKVQSSWSNASAMNRGQILYRIAEMLEGRKAQFVAELEAMGSTPSEALKEVEESIDRLVYYAGWSDKYQQVFSAVNPVASTHFNFSNLEPVGLVSIIAPVIVGGNSLVILASESQPLSAISFAEVLHSSDVPGGVVNILTGKRSELIEHMSSHMDVNTIIYCGQDEGEIEKINSLASENLKRTLFYKKGNWSSLSCESPYFIEKTQEIKTTWHPTEV